MNHLARMAQIASRPALVQRPFLPAPDASLLETLPVSVHSILDALGERSQGSYLKENAMTAEKMKSLVREYVAAFNRGDVEAVCRCFAPDAVVYGVLGWGDLTKARPIWEQLVTCFQMNLQVESIVAEEGIVAVRYTERGKFVAPFRGVEPTGKPYEVVAMEWFEIGDEGIVRRWGARDSAAIFRQMGIPLT
jgi:steroid delta-isomerase-like uncharacterized protein